ncbi:hypothetical protein ACEQ8H_007359 [Pleosporales sp. CAS-2024a]
MSSDMLTPDGSPRDVERPTQQAIRTQRVLACQLCQQRKVRCDRKFPCANCTKAGVQCVSTALASRQRRRRFPERELLERLRHYEELLRQNNIPFEPLHPNAPAHQAPEGTRNDLDNSEVQVDLVSSGIERSKKAMSFYGAMNAKPPIPANDYYRADDDEEDNDSDSSGYILREKTVKTAWDTLYDDTDHLLFCSRNKSIDLLALHPNQVHIFKIWQVYLENFDPLLKVTHAPSLQRRIVDAAGDLANVDPALEALMFSIYCVSIFSLGIEDCQKFFGARREDLLSGYQLGAREALLTCRFLRTTDRDVLTALHFYLMTVKPDTDPRSLSSILGSTVRIAQRMGIHDESTNVRHPPLEAELRRRLWWSIVLFDARISEMTDFRLSLLLPTWDCKPPLNANDFDFRADMKTPPGVHGMTSEALFAVIRAELGDYIRHCDHHLGFINPVLKSIVQTRPIASGEDEVDALQRGIETQYLQYCDPQNPFHFMTLWTSRGQIAKTRFLRYLAECSKGSTERTDAQRSAGVSYALSMLECDTKIMSSRLTKGYRWLAYLNFPFPAYVFVVQELRRRPLGDCTERAWQIMSDNCAARFTDVHERDKWMEKKKENPFFKIFSGIVLQAWAARASALANLGAEVVELPIVTQIKMRVAEMKAVLPEGDAADYVVGDLETNDQSIFMGPSIPSPYQDFGGVDPGAFQVFQEQDGTDFRWGWPTPHFPSMMGHRW